MATSVGKSRATRLTATSLTDRPWLRVASVIGLGVVLESVLRVTRFALPVAPAFVAFGLIALVLAGVRPRHVRTPVDLAIGASVLAGIIAFVINSHGGRRLIACVIMAGVFWLLIGVQRAWRNSRMALALTAALAVTITAGYAVIQAVFSIETGYCRAKVAGGADGCWREDTAIRVIGTSSNPNLLAPVLVLLIPIGCVALRMTFGKKWGRILSASLGVLGASALMLTLSRGGAVSMVVLLVAALALRNPSRRTLVGTGLAVVAGIIVALGALLAKFSLGPRSDVYRESLEVWWENPWGVGLGRSGPFIDQRIEGDQRFYHSHNLWLTWLVETGFIGLFAALWLTVAVTVAVVRGARRHDAMIVAAGSGLAGFGVISLFDNPSFNAYVSMAMWTVVAIAVSVQHEKRPRQASVPTEATP
ncbi:MAG TPA: O-antigen ligase family protein [Nocardioides sp.]